ncbi:hypothetical protein RVR34_13295 [Microcystis aeruginosa FBCC-A68]|uniref:hypothetical protein n=1 Tax=Microcystis aeruginosa TaxID=1126 RepID=UPI001115CB64|nr:hypothetical protein [Microcystis aeruginosa]
MAIDRTSWGAINILMVSLIYDKRAMPIYWEILGNISINAGKEAEVNLENEPALVRKHRLRLH